MSYQVVCVKCKDKYQSDEPDDFYCPPCLVTHKERAKRLDEQLKSRPRKPMISPLQEYDMAPKVGGFLRVRL